MNKTLHLFFVVFLCLANLGCPRPDDSQAKREKVQQIGKKSVTGKTANQGRQDAENDLAAGKLIVRTMPLPSPPWAGRHGELVREKGITMKSTKTVAEYRTVYIQAYNQRMLIEIDKKFGPRIIEKLENGARQELGMEQ